MKCNQFERGAKSAILAKDATARKELVQSFQNLLDFVDDKARSARGGHIVDYGDLEKKIREHLNDIEMCSHAHLLQAHDVDVPGITIGEDTYYRIGHALGTYNTMAGPVEIHRAIYRKAGERNSKTVDVISQRTGVTGRGWLPQTAASMAFMMQQGTSREAVNAATQLVILPYSRVAFERVGHLVGESYLKHKVEIEDKTIDTFEIPEETCAISVGLDRASIPLEEPIPRKPGRPPQNAPKRSIQRVFKMAYCGSLTLHDADGEALHTFRYGTMPEKDPLLLCWHIANDVHRIMERKPGLRLILLADGAHEMWDLLERHFVNDPYFGTPHRLVDFWHLVEKLSPAAKVIHGGEKGQAKLKKWRDLLLKKKNAAQQILDQLHQSGCEQVAVGEDKPVHAAITYLENHFVKSGRMDYVTARKWKLPIGSGNIEATCKTLVEVRMKRAGSRWKQDTGEHIVQLRALALSDRWAKAMSLLHERNSKGVRPAA